MQLFCSHLPSRFSFGQVLFDSESSWQEQKCLGRCGKTYLGAAAVGWKKEEGRKTKQLEMHKEVKNNNTFECPNTCYSLGLFTFGTPTIDTRSQKNCLKQNKSKSKANKKTKTCSCACLSCFSLFSRYIFTFRSVQRILLTGKSSHKCRSGTVPGKKQHKGKTHAKTKQIALLLHFHLLLFCIFFSSSQTRYLMVGHVWLPSLNRILGWRPSLGLFFRFEWFRPRQSPRAERRRVPRNSRDSPTGFGGPNRMF